MIRKFFSFFFKEDKAKTADITADTLDTTPPERLREIDKTMQAEKETETVKSVPKDDGSETIKVIVGQKISARVLAKMLKTSSSPKSAAALRESRRILKRIGLKFKTCSKNPKMVRVVSLS